MLPESDADGPGAAPALRFALQPHPHTPPDAVTRVECSLRLRAPHWLTLRWRIEGAGGLIVPPLAGKGRADGLWQTTCFELFVREENADTYCECNLSPSERWAAYDFSGYRADMADRPMPRDPVCTLRRGQAMAIFDAAIPLPGLPRLPWRFGLSAVIEETGGRKSYWALAHPVGKPDFHDPACFAAILAAPHAP